MKCYKCKATIPDGADFCPRCGVSQGFSPELIRKAKDNNQNAITELYNKTYSNVYYTIKAIVKDDDAVMDILQDSYLNAFRSLDQLQDTSKFRAWIKRIAHNRAVDYLRQTKAVNFSDISKDDTNIPLEFEDTRPENLPEVIIDQNETARLMAEILDSLPSDQRACVSMFYYEQMSVKEIAEELGISENTVKSRLNYGRKKIETQVRALENKGTKLYGLAPLPFLLILFKSQEAYAAEIPAATVLHSITAGLAAETATVSTAASTAGKATAKIATKTASHAFRTKIIAGVAAVVIVGGGGAALYHQQNTPTAIVQETQILPLDFLVEMETLATEKMRTLLSDNDYLELYVDGHEYDVTSEHIRLENTRLTKKAVYWYTGGSDALFVVYEGDIYISDDWSGFEVNRIPADYQDAAIVFALNSAPNKFLQKDGSIVYDDNDFEIYGLYESRQGFDTTIREEQYYDIVLP